MADAVIPTVAALQELSAPHVDGTDSKEDVPDNSFVASCRTNLSTRSSRSVRKRFYREGAQLLARGMCPNQHDEAAIDRISLLLPAIRNKTLGLQAGSTTV